MKVVTIGVDPETVDMLRDAGHDVSSTDGYGTDALREAGVAEADAVVVGSGYPTQVVVAKDINPDVRVIVVADDVPDFVSGNADLILSTELADRLPDALEDENEE
ncbi:MAG: NAD-binding protein [Halobacteriales archaeon]|nr:NAD-binding protein [Halobacteriales archaeon]